MPWIAAAVAASALIGAYSSSQAGKAQASAADNSAALQNQQYLQTREDLAPWRNSGVGALNQINALMGLGGNGSGAYPGATGVSTGAASSAPTQSPGVIAALGTQLKNGRSLGSLAKNALINPAGVGASILGVKDPLSSALGLNNNSAGQDIRQALERGLPVSDASWAKFGYGPGGAALGGNALQTPSLAQANPNGGSAIVGYNPDGSPQYGSINAFMGGGGTTPQQAQTNAFAQFQTDPGYQFAFDEGQKALTNSAAARGILNSGATAKALTRYGQGVADQQYGNYFARLQSLAGLGQTATTSTGQFGAQSAANQGNALMAAGNARASAYGGVATSANQGIQNYLAYTMNQNGGGYYNNNSGAA